MGDTNAILQEISDELHNLNFNMCELINVLKGKPQSSNTGDNLDDTLDALAEVMKASRDKSRATRSAETSDVAAIEAEEAYLKKQANLDKALKNLGVL